MPARIAYRPQRGKNFEKLRFVRGSIAKIGTDRRLNFNRVPCQQRLQFAERLAPARRIGQAISGKGRGRACKYIAQAYGNVDVRLAQVHLRKILGQCAKNTSAVARLRNSIRLIALRNTCFSIQLLQVFLLEFVSHFLDLPCMDV